MPKEVDDCVKAVMADGKTEDQAWAICRAKFSDKAPAKAMHKQFADLATYSSTNRTAVSIRDGVLEYLGAELGLEPADHIFTVYRSPATVVNAGFKMPGIPLTDEHIEMNGPAPDTGSSVTDAKAIDQVDPHTAATVAVQNQLSVSDAMAPLIQDKRELSLGYEADLVPHSKYDFEQIDIIPHHLAAVPTGRCGPLCSFLDRKPPTQPTPQEGNTMPKLHKAFCDADGAMSLEQVVEIAMELPEAIKKVPVEKLTELIPAMQEIMGYAKEQGAMPEEMTDEEGEEEMTDEDMAAAKEEAKEEFADSISKALGVKVKDAASVKSAMKKFADAEVKRYAEVVNKARNFLDADFDFSGKTANEIMREALATQSTDKFEDAELPIAFKLMRTDGANYNKFGDSNPEGGFESRLERDIAEG